MVKWGAGEEAVVLEAVAESVFSPAAIAAATTFPLYLTLDRGVNIFVCYYMSNFAVEK